MKELLNIQSVLKVPKSKYSEFGNYHYRSCEDILEELKKHLTENNCTLVMNDELLLIGDRYYIKATATIENSEGVKVSSTAYAREELQRKKMDASQLTGVASSYARKYALNGLFAIDDTKDADFLNKEETQNNNNFTKKKEMDPNSEESQKAIIANEIQVILKGKNINNNVFTRYLKDNFNVNQFMKLDLQTAKKIKETVIKWK